MRFSLTIILAFTVLVIINFSYVNAKHVATTTDYKIHSKTTLKHTDQTKDEHTTLKNHHGIKSSSTLISEAFTPLFLKSTTLTPEQMPNCPNGYYYHELYGCVKIRVFNFSKNTNLIIY